MNKKETNNNTYTYEIQWNRVEAKRRKKNAEPKII